MTRIVTWALGFAYAAAWGILGWLWRGPPTDLDYFFLPAVRIALRGHPLLVYTVRFQTVIANDNGPLGLVPLTAVAAVASWLGWPGDVRLLRALVLAAFSISTLLMAREAVKAIDRLRGVRLAGRSRVVAYGVFTLSPTLLIGVLGYGHVEQPMMLWLVLFAVRQLASDRPVAAGITFGLAMLTRSLAALPLIPVGVLLLARGRWRVTAWLTGSAAVVGTPYEWVPQHADVLFVFGLALLVSLVVILARRDIEASSRDIYGLLALTALALPLLAKSVWPYYFLDAYVFGAIWWLGQTGALAWGRRSIEAVLPLMAIIGTLLTEYEMGASAGRIRLLEGVGMGGILAVLMAALAVRLRRRCENLKLPNLTS
ncbi:MAG: hypothetical protein E6J16_09115 [Chloroflexota bacterium]|nr:MAG: hypothetical protein E6J16_09115 [Chloroflexota bacterium]